MNEKILIAYSPQLHTQCCLSTPEAFLCNVTAHYCSFCPKNLFYIIMVKFLVAQQLYMSSCFFFLFCLSHPSKYELTSPKTNSQVHIQTHKTILDLIWLNVLRNSCTVPYLFYIASVQVCVIHTRLTESQPNQTIHNQTKLILT